MGEDDNQKPLLDPVAQNTTDGRALSLNGEQPILIPRPEFQGRALQFFVLYFAIFVDMFGFGLIMPSLPTLITDTYDAPAIYVGVMVAAYSTAQMVGSLVCGLLSDKFGRKWVLTFCLLGSAVSLFLMGYCNSLLQLLLIRAADGAMSATIGVAQACVADLTLPSERAKYMGLVGAASGAGVVAGPALGGWIQDNYSFRVVCLVGAGVSAVNFVLAVFLIKESHTPQRRASIAAIEEQQERTGERTPKEQRGLTLLWATIQKDPNLLIVVLAFAFAQVGYTAFQTTYVLYADQHLDMTKSQVGGVFALFGVAMILTQVLLTGPASKYIGEKWTAWGGCLIRAGGLAAFPFFTTKTSSTVCVMAVAISGSLITPCLSAIIARFSDKRTHGTILGFNQVGGAAARAIAPLVSAYIYTVNYNAPFYFMGAGAVAVAALTLLPLRTPTPVGAENPKGFGVLDDESLYAGDDRETDSFSNWTERGEDHDDDYTDFDHNQDTDHRDTEREESVDYEDQVGPR